MKKSYRSQKRKIAYGSKTPKRRVRTHRKKLARRRVQTRRRKIYTGGNKIDPPTFGELQVFFDKFLNDISNMDKLRKLHPDTYQDHKNFDQFLVEQYNDMRNKYPNVEELYKFLNTPNLYRISIPKSQTITKQILQDMKNRFGPNKQPNLYKPDNSNKFDDFLKKKNLDKTLDNPIEALEYIFELYNKVTPHNEMKLGSLNYHMHLSRFNKRKTDH